MPALFHYREKVGLRAAGPSGHYLGEPGVRLRACGAWLSGNHLLREWPGISAGPGLFHRRAEATPSKGIFLFRAVDLFLDKMVSCR